MTTRDFWSQPHYYQPISLQYQCYRKVVKSRCSYPLFASFANKERDGRICLCKNCDQAMLSRVETEYSKSCDPVLALMKHIRLPKHLYDDFTDFLCSTRVRTYGPRLNIWEHRPIRLLKRE